MNLRGIRKNVWNTDLLMLTGKKKHESFLVLFEIKMDKPL